MKKLIFAFICLFLVVPCQAGIIYVDDDAPNDPCAGNPDYGDPCEDGSPEHPFDAVQEAIDVATSDDTVIVLDGTYTGPGNRDIDFLGKAITVRSESGPENCIIDCNGTETDPHRGFYFHNGEDANSVLDGFTITNGYRNYGGGVHCYQSGPTITNCIISGNASPGFISSGGGIYCRFGNPTIVNCTIRDNWAVSAGGGIFCTFSEVTLTNCKIIGNFADDRGGGIASKLANSIITRCTISGNSAWAGGGIYCDDFQSPTTPMVLDCTISDNKASYGGGGIATLHSSPVIAQCVISGNSAYKGGGLSVSYESPRIISCVISRNLATVGGAIGCTVSSPAIRNCTISDNSATDYGGGIYCWATSTAPTVKSSILWGNTAPAGSEIALVTWSISHPSELALTYSDVRGGRTNVHLDPGCTLDWQVGNIDADPCFVEPGYWDANDTPDDVNDDFWGDGDYHLLPDSLCIDTGDPNYLPEPNETDLDGNPRITGGRIDMGAYETNYIQAAMKFTPQTLNCNSKGNWVKAHLTLPQGFLPEDVDVNKPAWAEPMGIESEYIRVFGNDDGPVRLEIAFDREAFCETITETGEVEITVIGSLTTGRYFYASDTIRIKPRR